MGFSISPNLASDKGGASPQAKPPCNCRQLSELARNPRAFTQYGLSLLELAKKEPRNASIRLALGEYYLQQGFATLAEAEFKDAARLEPGNPQPPLSHVRLYLKLKDYKAADALLEQYRHRFPESWDFPAMQYMSLRAQGRDSEAERYLGELASRNDVPQPKLLKATVLMTQKKLPQALLLCDEVEGRWPDFSPVRLLKAGILYRLGRADE
ncbi:MAG TPA: tetratricopeptide repeat protein, partial [Candidatus Obscuribacterales bacterium]